MTITLIYKLNLMSYLFLDFDTMKKEQNNTMGFAR